MQKQCIIRQLAVKCLGHNNLNTYMLVALIGCSSTTFSAQLTASIRGDLARVISKQNVLFWIHPKTPRVHFSQLILCQLTR
jgi:hypothetical protein